MNLNLSKRFFFLLIEDKTFSSLVHYLVQCLKWYKGKVIFLHCFISFNFISLVRLISCQGIAHCILKYVHIHSLTFSASSFLHLVSFFCFLFDCCRKWWHLEYMPFDPFRKQKNPYYGHIYPFNLKWLKYLMWQQGQDKKHMSVHIFIKM